MAWWNSYDRNYRRYDRMFGERNDGGYRSSGRYSQGGMYDRDFGGGRNRYWGGASGWMGGDVEYDRMYRRPPEESPTYGEGGDEAVRNWARRYGYDEGYEIRPSGMGMGDASGSSRGGMRGGMNRSRETFGARGGQRIQYGRGFNDRYDRNWRW